MFTVADYDPATSNFTFGRGGFQGARGGGGGEFYVVSEWVGTALTDPDAYNSFLTNFLFRTNVTRKTCTRSSVSDKTRLSVSERERA